MHAAFRLAVAVAAALVVAAVFAAGALGHADLVGTKPRAGVTLERSPHAFVLTFDEAVEIDLVQLQVQDASGRRADRGEPYNPGGQEEQVAVRLRPELDGAYVASYRVISEDGHPVAKRTPFRVEPPKSPNSQETPGAGQMERGGGEQMGGGRGRMEPAQGEHVGGPTGDVTDVAFAAARGLGYLAIALAIGGGVFLVVVWLPALVRHAGAGAGWREASTLFVSRLKRVVLGAVLLGVVATAAAIVLEAATVSGISFWAALDADALEPVSDTRVVEAWGARLMLWLLFGGLLVLALRSRRAPVLRRAALGAEGVALGPLPARPQRLLLLFTVVALALTAPLAGHTATDSPEGLLICVGTAHVLAMSAWLGGLVMLLIAMPVAAGALSARERTPLLAAVVGRFSRMASIVVAVLVLSGIVQAVALVGSVPALYETAYGRLVLVKVGLLLALLTLGAYNQRRSLPRLRRLAAGGEEPGRAATILRRAVAVEVAFLLIVLGVTSVLVATEPPSG
jgi:copper transport protein